MPQDTKYRKQWVEFVQKKTKEVSSEWCASPEKHYRASRQHVLFPWGSLYQSLTKKSL